MEVNLSLLCLHADLMLDLTMHIDNQMKSVFPKSNRISLNYNMLSSPSSASTSAFHVLPSFQTKTALSAKL